MKRAVLIIVAALLVLLVYPSTHPQAKTTKSGAQDVPVVIAPFSGNGPPIAFSDDSDEESDDGDLDDVAGYKGLGTKPIGQSTINVPAQGVRRLVKVWWNFMIWIR